MFLFVNDIKLVVIVLNGICHPGLDGCAMKRFEVSPDGKYLAFIGQCGNIHLLTAQV